MTYPDGRTEVLLDVPRYDFGWQDRYVLAEPKRLPAGTVLRGVAHDDNSARNPVNPDPGATVRAGPQSTDEMFNGYYEVALADQDLTRPPALAERSRWVVPGAAVGLIAGTLLLLRFLGRGRPGSRRRGPARAVPTCVALSLRERGRSSRGARGLRCAPAKREPL